MRMPKASAIGPQQRANLRGKIEVLPHAIHSIAVQATCGCYGVVGFALPHLRNGQAVILDSEQSNQGVRVQIQHDQLIIDVYVALEYGLRISAVAQNIMRSVKFSVEKMLSTPVTQVNVNVQGLLHGPAAQASAELDKKQKK